MFRRIIKLFNRESPLEELGVFDKPEVSDRIIDIVAKIPKGMSQKKRKDFAVKAFTSKDIMIKIVEDLIHEHIKFRTRNISKPELTDVILGALNAFDAVIKSVEMWSAEHEQNVEDSKEIKEEDKHPDYPLSGSNLDIL